MKKKTILFSGAMKQRMGIIAAGAAAVLMIPAISGTAAGATPKPFIPQAGSIPVEETAVLEEQPYLPGSGGSENFRIPTLITLENGDLLTTADARWETTGDGGGLDIIASVSSDGGKTWYYSYPMFFPDSDGFQGVNSGNKHSDATTIIDSGIVEGPDGTVYCFADVNPTGSTTLYKSIGMGTGYVTVNGKRYLALTDNYANVETNPEGADISKYPYYVDDFDENGYAQILTRADSAPTGYGVDEWYNLYSIENGNYVNNLTQKQLASGSTVTYNDRDIQQNVYYKDSKFHVYSIGYIWYVESKDHGRTWENPRNINDQVKRHTDERAILVSPGKGITTSTGDIVLGYYTHGTGDERASLVYSNDNGKTWGRSNDIPATSAGGWQSSENEVVELPDGTLRMFFRSGGRTTLSYADAVRNADGSYTMGAPKSVAECTVYGGCNVTALNYSRKINGKPAIMVACPTASERINGKIFTFLIEEDNSMTLANAYAVPDRNTKFNYSCLTELPDGNIGLMWETTWTDIFYDTYAIADLVPGAEVENMPTEIALKEGGETFLVREGNGEVTKQPDAAVAAVETGERTKKVIPLHDHIANNASNLSSFAAAANANITIEEAEFTFTASGSNWYIKNEAKNVYLVNQDIDHFFVGSGHEMKVTSNGNGTFRICRSDGKRFIIFHAPEMNFNANTNDTAGSTAYELVLLEKQAQVSAEDTIPGYKRVSQVTSGKTYLISYIWTDGSVMVLYPQNGKANQSKLTGTPYDKTEKGISIHAVGAGRTTAVVDGMLYEIAVRAEYPQAGAGCAHSSTTVKGAIPASCTQNGYTGDVVCDACGGCVKSGEEIPATGHKWGAAVVTKAVTETADGEKLYTCAHEENHKKKEIIYASAFARLMGASREAAALLEDYIYYTKETAAALKAAYETAGQAAAEIAEGKDVKRSDMYKAAQVIEAAKEGLAEKSKEELTQELTDTAAAAKAAYEAGQGILSDETWAAFKAAYENAAKTNGSETISALQKRLKELAQTTKAMETEKDEKTSAAKAELEAGVNAAKGTYDAGQGNYTADSWKAFADAYQAAAGAPKDADAATLRGLAEALKKAQNALKRQPEPEPEQGLKAGESVVVNNVEYRVIDPQKKTAEAVKGKNPKAKKVVIAPTVSIRGISCKVVRIGTKAFSGFKNLKTATIGANVTTIGKQSFSNCKKLKKIIVKGTAVKTIKSGAFKKTGAKVTVNMPKKMKKKQKNALLKKMKAKGLSKKARMK